MLDFLLSLWDLDILQKLFDSLYKLTGSLAFVVGGIWVLRNYRRGRTHKPRLQVEVKAALVARGDRRFLMVTCQAKNVGLSIIHLPRPEADDVGLPGCAVRVRMLPRIDGELHVIEAPWDPATSSFDIFTGHQAIEPGLTISEQKLICYPDFGYEASWVQLRVSAEAEKWSAIAVAMAGEELNSSVLSSEEV